jgi:peptidoglycan-associated lipoprotein
VFSIPRHDVANAHLNQLNDRGYGRIWFDGTLASESVPLDVRLDGLKGTPVMFEVDGNRVVMWHREDSRLLRVHLEVKGDRMVGRMVDTETPGRVVFQRVRQAAAVAPAPLPVASAPAPAAPPAPAPPPAAAAPPPPPPVVAVRPEPKEYAPTDALKPIHFDFDRSEIRSSEVAVLEANGDWLKANREILIIIEGHCDERGTEAYNLALGERRARAVRDYLMTKGVAADRMTTVSYGEDRPVCREQTEECWQKNRRAAFVAKPK